MTDAPTTSPMIELTALRLLLVTTIEALEALGAEGLVDGLRGRLALLSQPPRGDRVLTGGDIEVVTMSTAAIRAGDMLNDFGSGRSHLG